MKKKFAKKGKVVTKPAVSVQSMCKLFKLPSPVFMEILMFSIGNGKELLEISVSCKRMFDFVYKDTRLWLSIYIKHFPKEIKPESELAPLKQRLKDGFKDTSRNWKDLYIASYKKHIEILYENSIKKLAQNFKHNLMQKLTGLIKTYNIKFTSKNGRNSQKIGKKAINYLGCSIILTVGHDNPVQKMSSLEIEMLGKKLAFAPKTRTGIKEGRVEIENSENSLNIMVDKDIYTEYWLISYYDIVKSILVYKHPVTFDDISSNFGTRGYSLILDVHNLTESLVYHYERCFDFSAEGSKISGHIEDLKYRIPKEKMIIKWKSLAFSDKFDNICLVDFVLCSEFGNPLSGGSAGGCLKLEETNSNDGDGYSLTIIKESVKITLWFRDKIKSFTLIGLNVEFDMSFIESIFKRDKPIRRK